MSCAFLDCKDVTTCCLAGGCVVTRFPEQQGRRTLAHSDHEQPKSQALNGTKPGRTVRDPALIKRARKPLDGPNALRHPRR
jgi:hypothetical protein